MSADKPCPICEATIGVTYESKVEKFPYGLEDEAVELEATVVEGNCAQCKFRWTDFHAEYARTEAVVRHLQKKNRDLRTEVNRLKNELDRVWDSHKDPRA